MLLLAFESSCDETSAAVIRAEGRSIEIQSNIVASQVATHALYGGVVPEIASRAHTESISRITYQALEQAGVTMAEIDAVAVTAEPGLIGALLVGVSFAKALAFAHNKPLVGVNHILGHIAANYAAHPDLEPPFLALVASGGHTSILSVTDYTHATVVGRTRDDAIGEAFDKVARVMGIPYPGGAEMDRLATLGDPTAIAFPCAALAGDTPDFSFSGLKTAVINHLNTCAQKGTPYRREDIAASFTDTVCRSVTQGLERAARLTGHKRIVLAGGVCANSHLRKAVTELAARRGLTLYLPPLSLCGDNAAMIGIAGYHEYCAGNLAGTDLNASPTSRREERFG